MFFAMHTLSFVCEYIYQKFCFPTSFLGYITSIFTKNSLICTLLRKNDLHLQQFMYLENVILEIQKYV
jgi:hypothetical protein